MGRLIDARIDALRTVGDLIGDEVRDDWTRAYLTEQRKQYLADTPEPDLAPCAIPRAYLSDLAAVITATPGGTP